MDTLIAFVGAFSLLILLLIILIRYREFLLKFIIILFIVGLLVFWLLQDPVILNKINELIWGVF